MLFFFITCNTTYVGKIEGSRRPTKEQKPGIFEKLDFHSKSAQKHRWALPSCLVTNVGKWKWNGVSNVRTFPLDLLNKMMFPIVEACNNLPMTKFGNHAAQLLNQFQIQMLSVFKWLLFTNHNKHQYSVIWLTNNHVS